MPESSQNVSARHTPPAGARPSAVLPPTGVFRRLLEQHQQARERLEQLRDTDDPDLRQQMWTALRRQLLSHERAEVLEIYAALEGYDAARDIHEQHTKQANELESIINELAAIAYDSEEWKAKLLDIAALFEEHAREEELEFFPRAQEILGEELTAELEPRYVSAQREIVDSLA